MLYLIVGPSCAGKNTLVNEVLRKRNDIVKAISTTTRPRREGEFNGRDYFFTTEADFMRKVKSNEMLEWFSVHGELYGTEISSLKGKNVIKIIDVQGASTLRKKGIKCIPIFIKASMNTIQKRLEKRKDPNMTIRLKNAVKELQEAKKYNYIIDNNGELQEAVNNLLKVIDKYIEK